MGSLTNKAIENLKPRSVTYEVPDGHGLALIVGARVKTWRMAYRFNGVRRNLTLGRFPEIGLHDARILHGEKSKILQSGIDPSVTEQAVVEHPLGTVAKLFECWQATALKKESSKKEDVRQFDRDVREKWGDRHPASITRTDTLALLDGVAKRSAHAADHLVALLSPMFDFGRDRVPGLTISPCYKIKKYAAAGDGVIPLDPAQIAPFWLGLDKINIDEYVRAGIKMALLTGQRPNEEVARMEWSEIEDDIWTIPGHRMKVGGKPHDVPLSPLAQDILRSLRETTTNPRFVFASRGTHIAKGTMMNAIARNREALGLRDHQTLYSLRKTLATTLGEVFDYSLPETAIVLSHADGSVTARYNRATYNKKKREMLTKFSTYLTQLVDDYQRKRAA